MQLWQSTRLWGKAQKLLLSLLLLRPLRPRLLLPRLLLLCLQRPHLLLPRLQRQCLLLPHLLLLLLLLLPVTRQSPLQLQL